MDCTKCGLPKTTKGKSVCTECKREYDKKYYANEENRRKQIQRAQARSARIQPELSDWYRKLKNAPCTDCGERFHFAAMHWDHLPGYYKEASLGRLVRNGSKCRILAEIAKCELVCANCHAVRTFERRLGSSAERAEVF